MALGRLDAAYQLARTAVLVQSPLFPRDLLCNMQRWTAAVARLSRLDEDANRWDQDAMRIEQNGLDSLSLLKLLKPAQRRACQFKLTSDERTTLQLTAEGSTLKMIADQLDCSVMSVKRLLSAAREKYMVANTNALIAKAVDAGEIKLPTNFVS